MCKIYVGILVAMFVGTLLTACAREPGAKPAPQISAVTTESPKGEFMPEQVEKDLRDYIKLKTGGKPYPAEPFELVINPSPANLEILLRAKSRGQLIAILSAIVTNTQERGVANLAMIFNACLPDEGSGEINSENGLPWERKYDRERPSVLGLTTNQDQKEFLAEMELAGKNDLANRRCMLDYIMNLRTVRYREDIIGLLESQPFFDEKLAKSLKKGSKQEDALVLADIDEGEQWPNTRIAHAISLIVSIQNEKAYCLVRKNHMQRVKVAAPGIIAGS